VYWSEILYRAHMAAASALLRTHRWLAGAVSAIHRPNILSHAANLRGLLEACADTYHSLRVVPGALAGWHAEIRRALAGEQDKVWTTDLEDTLIHFLYGRKVARGETAPDSHRALCSRDYLDSLREAFQRYAIDSAAAELAPSRVGECYGRLCELVHPA